VPSWKTTLPDHIGVADRCASLQRVGAPRRSIALSAAVLLLAGASPAASAKGDLTVSVGKLAPPKSIALGRPATFTVRYIVRGPLARKASATVQLLLQDGRNRYLIKSNPHAVTPAIWTWTVTDELPRQFDTGDYKVTATVTLKRRKHTVDSATAVKSVTVMAETTGGDPSGSGSSTPG
jgi:hypothetical protein